MANLDELMDQGVDAICSHYPCRVTDIQNIYVGTWYECDKPYHGIRAYTSEDVYIIPDTTCMDKIHRYHGDINHSSNSKLIKRIVHDLCYEGYRADQIEQLLYPYAQPFTMYYDHRKGDVWDEN